MVRNKLLWLQGTLITRQSEGAGFFWGRKRREAALIRSLLLQYPGLSEKSTQELQDVAVTVFRSLYVRKRHALTLLGAFVAVLASFRFVNILPALGYSLPGPLKFVFVVAATILVTDQIRRWHIRSAITSAVAAAFPDLFCTCGYSLIGLPLTSVCPECGATPPVTRASSPC